MPRRPKKLTRKQFADYKGWSPSYVSKLTAAGRLIFTDDKKYILVKESLDRIEGTKDPNRDDVVARHKRARKKKTKKSAIEEKKKTKKRSKESGKRHNSSYSENRAEKEYYLAQKARLEYLKEVGEQCDISSANHAGGEVGAIMRAALENQPDQLSAILAAENDENRVHALMVEYNEQLLHDMADRMKVALGKMLDNNA